MFIKIGNSDFWVDEIQWNGQVNVFRNRLVPKILRCWTTTKMFFVCFVNYLKTNYTFRQQPNGVTNQTIVIIRGISVIKCINRYSCGLFNSCCGMKISFFSICIEFKQSSFFVLIKKALTMISSNFLFQSPFLLKF